MKTVYLGHLFWNDKYALSQVIMLGWENWNRQKFWLMNIRILQRDGLQTPLDGEGIRRGKNIFYIKYKEERKQKIVGNDLQ